MYIYIIQVKQVHHSGRITRKINMMYSKQYSLCNFIMSKAHPNQFCYLPLFVTLASNVHTLKVSVSTITTSQYIFPHNML